MAASESQGSDKGGFAPSTDDLKWLNVALFREPVLGAPHNTQHGTSTTSLALLPFRGIPRRLVPVDGPFAANAFTNRHDAMSRGRRLAGRATGAVARLGALRIAPKVDANTDALLRDATGSVIAAAGAGLGVDVAACAITLGPRRYNRKPVVQLMDADARTVGFLKVGADATTSTMVATEASFVDALRRNANPALELPELAWSSTWQGRSVACFTPVGQRPGAVTPPDARRLAAVAASVVDAGGGATDIALRDAAPIERVRTAPGVDDQTLRLVDRVEKLYGTREVSVGIWHGDFSPWNMISTDTTTALIDWEFAADGMPVGADLLHHRVMVATHLEGEPGERPLRQLVEFGTRIPALKAVGVEADRQRGHLLLYLLELIRRDLELDAAGLETTGLRRAAFDAATAILDETGHR